MKGTCHNHIALAVLLVALCALLACDVEKPAVDERAKVSQEQSQAAEKLGVPVAEELDLGGGVKLKLVLIPAGESIMGSPRGEEARENDEGPQHRVRITKAFYMGTTEVTKG